MVNETALNAALKLFGLGKIFLTIFELAASAKRSKQSSKNIYRYFVYGSYLNDLPRLLPAVIGVSVQEFWFDK